MPSDLRPATDGVAPSGPPTGPVGAADRPSPTFPGVGDVGSGWSHL